jgi:enoyl-CoA hydratase/carnithine racemase
MTWSLTQQRTVAVLTFDRPPDNQMRLADLRALDGHLDRLAADDSVSVVLLASDRADYFVAHADRKEIARMRRGEPVGDTLDRWRTTLLHLEDIPQPTVAVIDGQAWGGGCELALACTFRLGTARAHLACHEVAVGAMPGAGATQRLPRLIGPSRAARMILTAQPIDAGRARELGLLDEVIDGSDPLAEAIGWTASIAHRPRAALAAAKRSLLNAQRLPLLEGLKAEQQLFSELLTTD